MTRLFFSIFAVLLFVSGFAQRAQQSREEYIKKFCKLAIAEMERSGIPASITLAQGCWESNNGNSRLAVEGNNHFGIKCKSHWTGKRIFHDDDAKGECFRKYAHAEASYIDHSDFLMSGSRYSFLFKLDPRDYAGWARGLKQAGYATDPTYAERLIKIIEDYKLYLYDEYGAGRPLASKQHDTTRPDNIQTNIEQSVASAAFRIELRNGLKTIVVQPSDTYDSITKRYKLKNWELYTYNEFSKGRQPVTNEILYIEAKHRRAGQNQIQHLVGEGETMHYIAQRYGIKLKPLLRRNRMNSGEEPAIGQIIYLKHKKPRK